MAMTKNKKNKKKLKKLKIFYFNFKLKSDNYKWRLQH